MSPPDAIDLDWRVEAATRLSADAGRHRAGAPVVKMTIGPRDRHPALAFASPSPPALQLGAAIDAARRAEEARSRLEIGDLLGIDRVVQQIVDASLPSLFDFFQEAFVSVVFSYVAVEAFANQEIRRLVGSPRRVLVRGQVQLMEAADIERSTSTEDKLVQVLPAVAGAPTPRKAKWWPQFKRLARLRNDLTHMKEGRAYPRSPGGIPPASIFHELLTTNSTAEYPRTAIRAIRHFTAHDPPWLAAAAERVESP